LVGDDHTTCGRAPIRTDVESAQLVAQVVDDSLEAGREAARRHAWRVRNHVSNIFTKLQVADRAQAIVKAREAGLGVGPG